ncbi:lysine transporter LysE [Streptomyces sp. NPDC059452]|uniref:lysine transporter LysE n=1 Tax=Streptomyces sp. NPDC059452 TaxID=3346835 RepID=UPI0036860D6F
MAKGVKDFVVDLVGEFVGEVILSVLACALLAGLVLAAYLSWSFSPRLTLAGAALLSLFLAHGAWTTSRGPAKGGRRAVTAVAAAGFTLTAGVAFFLLFYATDCGCL